MPTADLAPDKEFIAEIQFDGAIEHFGADTRLLNFEVGFADRLEAGLDYDASEESDEPWLFNGKLKLWQNAKSSISAAAGVRNYGAAESPEAFGVAMWSLDMIRLHAGATFSDELREDGVVGADCEWRPGWWGFVEWTSGPENSGAVGLNVPLPGPLDLLGAVTIPNSSREELGYTMHLVWSALVPVWNEGK